LSASGIPEIIDKAGVPKGSFYNYFKAKETLALEVLGLYGQGSRREMLADSGTPPVLRLRQHFERLMARHQKLGYARGCLFGNFAAEMSEHTPQLRQAISESLERWTLALAGVLREAQQEGSVTAEQDAEQIARFLVNAWEGAVMRMKVTGARLPLEDFLAVTFSSVVHR
jgi:TetR/AcrR family transcriptional regulator, transcriptional repressor for nem operon